MKSCWCSSRSSFHILLVLLLLLAFFLLAWVKLLQNNRAQRIPRRNEYEQKKNITHISHFIRPLFDYRRSKYLTIHCCKITIEIALADSLSATRQLAPSSCHRIKAPTLPQFKQDFPFPLLAKETFILKEMFTPAASYSLFHIRSSFYYGFGFLHW